MLKAVPTPGEAAVLPCTTASGAMFTISSPNRLAVISNGTTCSIAEGIEPGIVPTKPEAFYDRPALVEYLCEAKQATHIFFRHVGA